MFSLTSRFHLLVLFLASIPVLLQGCGGSTQYLAQPHVRSGVYADVFNFSDTEIHRDDVDKLYLEVADLMAITPDRSKPRPQVFIVSAAQIRQEYVRFRPAAKTSGRMAMALYIPHQNKILIPYFDRTLLVHELAHYFSSQYLSLPQSKWEADRKSTRLNSSHSRASRMPSSA